MTTLPDFLPTPPEYAHAFAVRVFGDALVGVTEGTQHTFRALFELSYFTLADDATEPSRSQWNTLKKRMKRMNPAVSALKSTGIQDCGELSCGYVDFGFLRPR
jgi:hypothetical protein